jgi:lipid A 3-O-deacylase
MSQATQVQKYSSPHLLSRHRWLVLLQRLLVVAVLSASWQIASAAADGSVLESLRPTGVFVQAGFGESNTNAYVVGALWDWRWSRDYSFGRVTGYSDASFGRWSTDAQGVKGSTWATQVGITPVVRLQPAFLAPAWFVELGIGANVILPIYRNEEKRFSTEFNFGDHLGVGYQFGEMRHQELMIRVQHFSNGGIKHPNPGENFVQLRYSYRYRL